MLEKVIENWLDSASEKSFQEAFCSMLAAEGHTIIHSTRHCAMELGKDIVTIAPDGIPCAYQLKGNPGSRLTLSQWREVSTQVFDMVTGKLVHPSIDSSKPFRSYLVTNGNLDEEVSRQIDDMNRSWAEKGLPYKLEVIVRGQMLEKAKALGETLWPSELTESKTLLELFLSNGRSPLLKDKLVDLLEAIFQINNPKVEISGAEWGRITASAALLCVIATSTYRQQKNYLAQIEAWTVYLSYLWASVDRFNLDKSIWKNEVKIATDAVLSLLHEVHQEIESRKGDLVEGDPLIDQPFGIIGVRLIWLTGLMSVFYLLRRELKEPEDQLDNELLAFIQKHTQTDRFICEYQVSQLLAVYFVFKKKNLSPDVLLSDLLQIVYTSNQPGSDHALPSPYHSEEEVLLAQEGIKNDVLSDHYAGSSYSLESLIYLAVRRNLKDLMIKSWSDITRMSFKSFVVEKSWNNYCWRNQSGINKDQQPKHTKQWDELVKEANEDKEGTLPVTLRNSPALCLLWLMVFPFRITPDLVKWLDKQFS